MRERDIKSRNTWNPKSAGAGAQRRLSGDGAASSCWAASAHSSQPKRSDIFPLWPFWEAFIMSVAPFYPSSSLSVAKQMIPLLWRAWPSGGFQKNKIKHWKTLFFKKPGPSVKTDYPRRAACSRKMRRREKRRLRTISALSVIVADWTFTL